MAKEERGISEISSLRANSNPSPQERARTIMKLKRLKKKIQQLERRLQEGPDKLAKLRRKLEEAESAKWLKAAKKSAARSTAVARADAKSSTSIEKKSPAPTTGAKKPRNVKKAKRKLNLSPERRAQLAAAMKARWAAKRAAEASTTTVSTDQNSPLPSTTQVPESRPDDV